MYVYVHTYIHTKGNYVIKNKCYYSAYRWWLTGEELLLVFLIHGWLIYLSLITNPINKLLCATMSKLHALLRMGVN